MVTLDNTTDTFHIDIGKILHYLFKKIWIFILCVALQILIPSKTTMYLMLGSSYLSSSNIPSQVSEIINFKLTDIIKDMKKG